MNNFLDSLESFASQIKFLSIGLSAFFYCVLAVGKSPNFVLVYVDDLGWAETSVEMIKGREDTRSDFNRTPNVERLAREGMVLSTCYSPSALPVSCFSAWNWLPGTSHSSQWPYGREKPHGVQLYVTGLGFGLATGSGQP